MTSRYLGINTRVSLVTLREPLTSEEATSKGRNRHKTFDMAGAGAGDGDTKYPPLPDIAKERSNKM